MDTPISGGMAPALRSTNHQSTDLVKKEANTNGLSDILPLEKVNGSAHQSEHLTQVSDLVKPRPEILKVKGNYAAGDAIVVNSPSEQSMTVTEAYLLNIPKAAQQPSISASRPHIGQGDCPASVTTSQNGWNNYKKSVLQENNNSPCKMCHASRTMTRTERSTLPVGSTKQEKIQERSNKNCHNGGMMAEKKYTMPQIGLTNTSTTMTFTSAVSKSAFVNTNSGYSCSVSPNSDNPIISSACSNVKLSHDRSENCVADEGCLKGDGLLSHVHTDCPSSSPLQVLKHTDLLSDDLSKINVPDKLAHTLQELAASLKGQQFGSEQRQALRQDRNSTVKRDDQERPCRSVKSLDFNIREHRGSEDMKKSMQLKLEDAKSNAVKLQDRLSSLKSRVDLMRLRSVEQHVKQDIRRAVRTAAPCSGRGEQKHVNTEKWDDEIIDITNVYSSNMQSREESKDSNLKFWSKILEKQSKSNVHRYPSIRNGPRKCLVVKQESQGLSKNTTTASVTSTTASGHRPISPEMYGINMDPIVQLTRVEHSDTSKNAKPSLMKRAKVNCGVLLKELKYVRSHCDPDVTDSSSDDEIPDSYGEARKHLHVSTKMTSKGSTVSQTKRHRRSFCRWVAERAEISRRWTWLQSRISNLEFNIRQQGDLYRKHRAGKGVLRLDTAPKPLATNLLYKNVAPETTTSSLPGRHAGAPLGSTVSEGMPSSTSPCNLNDLLSNVRNQTSRIFDNLSPLSGGSPSPSQVSHKSLVVAAESAVSQHQSSTRQVTDTVTMCARAKPLCLTDFKRRRLVKFMPSYQRSEKPLKQRTVPNDSSIMGSEVEASRRRSLTTFQSVALKAAAHDHSYHVIISSMTDIPLSVTTQALMKSKRKWCEKATSPAKIARGSEERSAQHLKDGRKKGKQKKKQKKNSKHMLPPNYSADDHGVKRKRYSSQVSQQSDTNRKRHRGMSFDSDLESCMMVGTLHPPSRSTPTHDTSQQQSYWRKKKSSEQAYDINNIVIPHGLNSARIEKLAYKEIQTPSWKLVELKPEPMDSAANADETVKDEEFEDTTCGAFQRRHDRYEILEKKKYMAYMEWSISRKGRGSRMSNIGGGATPEPASPASPNCTPSPVPFTVEGHRVVAPCTANDQVRASVDPPSPSASAQSGVRTRRMSAEQNPARPVTPLSHFHQTDTDTSLGHSYSSPTLACWQDGLGSRRSSAERAAPINRTMSEGSGIRKNSEQQLGSWEVRTFPLQGEDILLLEDTDFASQRQRMESSTPLSHMLADGDDGGKPRCFRPVSRQSSTDCDGATHSSSAPDQSGKTLSTEALQDHQRLQASKSGTVKRRRTDSRASSLASYDDSGRHSDASNASASSAHRRRKRVGTTLSRASSHQGHEVRSQNRQKDGTARATQLKHSFLQLRLSETEDSSSDTDSDESRTSGGTSTSFDDAGHIVDDFGDPEWDFNASKHRDRR